MKASRAERAMARLHTHIAEATGFFLSWATLRDKATWFLAHSKSTVSSRSFPQSVSAAALRRADAPSLGPLSGNTTNTAPFFLWMANWGAGEVKHIAKIIQLENGWGNSRRKAPGGLLSHALPQRQRAPWRRKVAGDHVPCRLIFLSNPHPLPFRVQAWRGWLKGKTKRPMCFPDPRVLDSPRPTLQTRRI